MNAAKTKPALGVVIPALNAAPGLRATLAALEPGRQSFDLDIVVVDGGSEDETVAIAESGGARVVTSEPGRGLQLHTGAGAVAGEGLLFLHADTVLSPDWAVTLRDAIEQPGADGQAFYFRFALDDSHPGARRVEHWVARRCRNSNLPYGDQGLALPRDLYDKLEGFAPMRLMEDVNFVTRIKHRCGPDSLIQLDAVALTSAERYRRDGYWVRPARNALCRMMYFAGFSLRSIAKVYG
jgi:rSAM/selenodomain-associated transferase 2